MQIELIQNKIYEIRGQKVMLDFDLADLYEVETKRLNEQVKRNITRFPEDFMFRLTKEEWGYLQLQILAEPEAMRSQFATASQKKRNINIMPYAFTEHGRYNAGKYFKERKSSAGEYCHCSCICSVKEFINTL